MKLLIRPALITMVAAVVLGLATHVFAFQRIANWGEMNPQSTEKAEFSWSRLSYNQAMGGGGYGGYGGYGRFGRGWGTWNRDYPKADRQFLVALNRLTRINGRSTEQVVSLDSDDIFNYPFVYAVMVHTWTFNEEEAKRMREYLLKGGFLMVDDFHGTAEWEQFMEGMRQIFPDAAKYPVEDLNDKDEIFHVLYDMDDRFQVPGEHYVRDGQLYEQDGYVAKWRGIRDEHGRLVVAICHNMHLGDAWEWADDPDYPEQFASMAFRVGLNYVMYSMTH
jgi:hypothetical protein